MDTLLARIPWVSSHCSAVTHRHLLEIQIEMNWAFAVDPLGFGLCL